MRCAAADPGLAAPLLLARAREAGSASASASASAAPSATGTRGGVTSVLPHVHALPFELQDLFLRVVAAVKEGDAARIRAGLSVLSTAPGLQQLVPYFSQLVADEVGSTASHSLQPVPWRLMRAAHQIARSIKQASKHSRVLPYLRSLVRLVRCLLVNAHLQLELYVRAPPAAPTRRASRLRSRPRSCTS